MKIKLFYSWQTDTSNKINRNFIFDCIEKAVKLVCKKPEFENVEFEILEGVTNEPGSVAVANQITDSRIPNSDIFIADLTVVNHLFPEDIPADIVDKLKQSIKPSPNPNVLLEYGVAYRALGVEKIIGVLNNLYGSPKSDNEKIPFDLRHLRFPIEYTLSEKISPEEKAEIKKSLISNLAGAINTTAIYSIQHRKNKFNPFIVWEDWEKETLIKQKFYEAERIIEIKNDVHKSIHKPKESARLLGLSGLGKSRILLECFRCNANDEKGQILKSRILYLNYSLHPNIDINSVVSNIQSGGADYIVILDNCPLQIHRNLLPIIRREDNNISLITVDSNPEEIHQSKVSDVNYISLKKEDLSEVVDQIINADDLISEQSHIEKIKEFSQGIPLMAVLLIESIKNGEKFIGRIADKDILDKLLGVKGQDSRVRTILKSCSIFNNIGTKDGVDSQLNFIATNKDITSLDGTDSVLINEFREVCSHYLKREIFETKGRFIGMRPFPLAMSLTQEWLDTCYPDRIINVITSIAKLDEPDRKLLTEALSERMKYLGYDDNANLIIENIVGPTRPFDNAEVLNTELGSRLFRSFVEVNPVAISDNLVRQFSTKTKEELLNVKEGRRNLVWVLEKLCFDKRTFSNSIKILFAFAIAENETWSNNATGQFLQLFNVQLAGTEADLSERWKIIEWGLNKNDIEYKTLAIKAMGVGLGYGHSSRMIGAEIQGTKRLEDYIPTFSDVSEYWNNILQILTELIISADSEAEFASSTICNNLRGICRARFADIVFPYLDQLIEYKKNDWDELLTSLKHVRKYDKSFLTPEQFTKIEYYIERLTKTDFLTRYLTASKSYHLDNDDSFSTEKVIELLEKLADEFITSNLSWTDYFPVFYKNQQVFSYHFGKRIYSLLHEKPEKVNEFIKCSVVVIKSIDKDERNVLVLGGFINEANEKLREEFYNLLYNSDLDYLLFYFISINPNGKKYFSLLLNLVDDRKCEVSNFNSLSYGKALEKMDLKELEDFSQKLFNYGKEGYTIIFDLFFSLGYRNKELKLNLVPIYEKCIIELGIIGVYVNQLDDYKWSETICYILNDKSKQDFALFINKSIIESISYENSYHLDHSIQKIYEVLLKVHFQDIWPDLSNALLSSDELYMKFYGLKHILGSHIGGVGRSIGVLFIGDIDSIFKWCHLNKPLAPARLAELVPIYDNDNTDYSNWHSAALRLLDEFGDIDDVLSHLSSNMGTYSWTGSLVPLLEAKKELFNKIKNHKINAVSEWANKYLKYTDDEISREKTRDEEMYL